jgi:undecaprenyl-diphosphatase
MPTDLSVPQAIILAFVQGLTEFLPISSKTHLLFTRHFLHLPEDIFFDVMLHVGSLGAILVYYWRTWLELLTTRRSEIPRLVLGSIPLVFAGLLLRKRMEHYYENLLLASGMLLVTATWLFVAERFSRARQGLLETPLWKIVLIGLAQACAVFPGISRSGSTIGMGYLTGLHRPEAVRFSFFLGAIGIFGAGLFEGKHAIEGQAPLHPAPILIGIVVTFAVSWAAIRVVEKLSRKGGFYWFSIYCAVAGAAGLLYFSRG